MNIINANGKEYRVIDGSVLDAEARLIIEVGETDSLESIESDFLPMTEKIELLNEEKEVVAKYKGFDTLKYIKKNVEDSTVEICITKMPLEKRIKEIENTLDVLTTSILGAQKGGRYVFDN